MIYYEFGYLKVQHECNDCTKYKGFLSSLFYY